MLWISWERKCVGVDVCVYLHIHIYLDVFISGVSMALRRQGACWLHVWDYIVFQLPGQAKQFLMDDITLSVTQII